MKNPSENFKYMIKAIGAIEKKEKENVSQEKEIECQKCGKKLHYIKSSYNGHIWGTCETEKCLSWMM